MTDVGSARVEVTGDVRGFARQTERDLNRALDGVDLDPVEVPVDKDGARRAGEDAGEAFGDGVYRGADGRLRDLNGRFVREGEAAGREGGRRAGEKFGDEAEKGVNKRRGRFRRALADLFDIGKDSNRVLVKSLGAALTALPMLLNPALVAAGLGIAAGLAAVIGPAIGGLISAAIIAGGGLGFIGLGAFLLKEEPGLKSAAKSLSDTVKKTFTKAAQPMLKPLISALNVFKDTAVQIGPQIGNAFKSLAPAIVPFAQGIAGLVKNALPGFNQMMAAAAPLLISIAGVLPDLGSGFSDFFASIAAGGPGATAFITDFLRGTGDAIAGLGAAFGWLASQYPKVRDPLIQGFRAIKDGVVEFWSAFEGDGPAAISIFQDFASAAGAAIGLVGKAIGWLVGQYPAIRDGAVKTFDAVISSIQNTVAWVQANKDWLGPLASSVAGAAIAFGALKTATNLWTAAVKIATAVQIAYDAALAANPIGLIIVAIGALVGALIWFFTQTETGREIWATTWAAIKTAAQAVADWFMGTVVPALSAAWSTIMAAASAVASWFTGTLVPALSAAWSAIQSAASAVAGWFMTYVVPVFTAIGGLIAAIFARIVQAAQFMWSLIQPIFTLLGTAWSVLWGQISAVWNAVGPVIFAAIGAALNVLQSIWTTTWNILKTVVVTVFNVVKQTVQTALQVIAGVIRAVTAVINGNWSAAWNEIKGVVTNVMNGTRAVITSVMNGVKGVIVSILNGIKSTWSAVWNGLKNVVSAALNGLKGLITGIFGGAGSWLVSAGRKIIDGLISGIKSGFDRVRGLLSDLTGMLPDWKGPAQVDRKILEPSGDMVMAGFERGLENRFASIRKTLGDLTGDLPSFAGTARGGDGASAANPGGGRTTTVTFAPGSIVIQGGGTEAGQEAAEAILEALANAQD